MKLVDTAVLSLVLAGAALAHASLTADQSQQPTFRSAARTVAVYATVTDRGGRLLPDLGREVFEVRESGKTQPLTVFSNEVQPITVVMMLDRSSSMRGNFTLVQRAAEAFVKGLGPDDKARIGSFAERIEIQPAGFTSDHAELVRLLRADLQREPHQLGLGLRGRELIDFDT